MELNLLKPRIALNKAFLKVKPNRQEIELFKKNLISLIDTVDEYESEEFHKNLVSDFLKNTYYGTTHYINTKDRKDLVIHNGANASSTVGVIIEAKSPVNKAEMLRPDQINNKAFQELVLYYMRERITHKNLEIKHLIVTNIYEWYIFDAHLFEKEFAQNKSFVKKFVDFEEGRSGGNKTEFFYREIAAPVIEVIKQEICFTHFDIRDYSKPLRNTDKKDDNQLIALFKLLSPEHLLKLPFANDSNSLDKTFYTELLHIIGLTETKEGGKKLITRKKEGERNAGSLIESAIIQLDSLDKISRLDKPSQFGDTYPDRLFNVALELSITWVNRILFLKLLEAQLIKYHKGDKQYAFLNLDKVQNFDKLNSLFFSVLARKPQDRNDEVKQLFANVPYLNSSLFEPTDIEHACLFISQLNEGNLPVLSTSVIKDNTGKKRTGELTAMEYIFEFLNAYDFASEGSEEIQEDNKRLINASVLGLIFEKINGYKDGSFFTPGFITMYMCRETIRRAVVQKFNETKGWNCTDLHELYDRIEDKKEANTIFNSLKICDPAVGSGHFLVSALNEIIAIKSELKILLDRGGKTLRDYHVEVENDELIITDDDGKLFEYKPTSPESQRIQETLFHEKQTIIENCLFGVDLNPNSVKICRLRLWIELLKNAYYRTAPSDSPKGGGQGLGELETLPNIDINIKCGNSLISRYALDTDIKKALKGSKWNIESYRLAIMTYRNAASKDEKHAMEKLINEIKNDFVSEIASNDKRLGTLNTLRGDLYNLSNQTQLFELSKAEKAKFNKAVEEKTIKIAKLDTELEEIRNNKIYENAFEWRFEFPEVLNDEGDFVGFDVVIGNPPYMRIRDESIKVREYYLDNYKVSENQLDLYHLFIEKSFYISNSSSIHSLIVPNAFLANQNNIRLRKFILDNFKIAKIIDVKDDVFDEASVDVLIYIFTKLNYSDLSTYYTIETGDFIFKHNFDSKAFYNTSNNNFTVTVDSNRQLIIDKILNKSIPLTELFDTISGIKEYQIGKGKPLQTKEQVEKKEFNSKSKVNETYLPELRGKNILKYNYDWSNEYISYGQWLAEPRVPGFFKGEKIIVRQIPGKKSLIAAYVNEDFIVDQTAYIAKPKTDINILFYLGVINSKLLYWYFQNMNNEFDLLFPKIKVKEFNSLPLPKLELINNEISNLVVNILKEKENTQINNNILMESEIDRLVYQLYGLTVEEIGIVEGK